MRSLRPKTCQTLEVNRFDMKRMDRRESAMTYSTGSITRAIVTFDAGLPAVPSVVDHLSTGGLGLISICQ